MDKFTTGKILPYSSTAVALGQFDGMHLAHKKLIDSAIASDRCVGVMYFATNPKGVKKLMSDKQKLSFLNECDFAYIQDFNDAFKGKSPEEFADFLVGALHVEDVFIGYNYRFGKDAVGDANLLAKLGMDYGFNVHVLDKICIEGETVCSSAIRSYIEAGDVTNANKLLGRQFSIDGKIIHGKQNGHKMGLPTINVDYESDILLPKFGVYGGSVLLNGKSYQAIINVGNNPTFNAKKITLEAHLLDYNNDVYGEYAEVFFDKFVRGEIKFKNTGDLIKQIKCDILAIELHYDARRTK